MKLDIRFAFGAVVLLIAGLALVPILRETPAVVPGLDPASPDARDGEHALLERPVRPKAEPSAQERAEMPAEDPESPAMTQTSEEPPAPPAGCLRIVASQDDRPLAGVSVLVSRTRNNWLPREVDLADGRTTQHRLDERGRTDVCSLAAGDYLVGLELHRGQTPQYRIKLASGVGQLVEFRLFGADLHGIVRDSLGSPAPGARVSISGMESVPMTIDTWTDGSGSYRLEGLAPAPYWVSARLDGSHYSDPDHMLQVAIEAGKSRRLDLGPSPDAPTWAGTVRNLAGDAIQGAGAERVHLAFIEVDSQHRVWTMSDAEGRFSIRLEPGSYSVLVTPPGHHRPQEVLSSVEVGPVDLERDLVLAGTRVHGRILNASSMAPARIEPRNGRPPEVRAHLSGHTYPSAFLSVPVSSDGSYALDGLGPGMWKVGLASAGLDNETEVLIEEDVTQVVVDITVDH